MPHNEAGGFQNNNNNHRKRSPQTKLSASRAVKKASKGNKPNANK